MDPRDKYIGMYEHATHPGKESKYFQSWGDLLEFVTENKGRGQGSGNGNGRRDWYGTSSLDEAVFIAKNGWNEGVLLAKPMCTSILNKVTSMVEIDHIAYDVEGLGLDVATYLNGEPECWQRFESYTQKGEGVRHLRIVMDVTVSSGIDKSVILARGSAVAALIQSLEFAGIRVQFEVLPLCNGISWESRVLVKSSDQDLDMSRVIFATAHPSMLRRIGFGCQDGCPSRDNNRGYGPCSTSIDKGDIYIGSAMFGDVQWKNEELATNWVLSILKEQGVHIVTE